MHPMFFEDTPRKQPQPCSIGRAIIASDSPCPTIEQHATRCPRCKRYVEHRDQQKGGRR